MWRDMPLPEELTVGMRLVVRAYQLAAFSKFSLDTTFAVQDVERLFAQSTEKDGFGVVAVAVQSLNYFRMRDPQRVLQYIRRAIALPQVFDEDARKPNWNGCICQTCSGFWCPTCARPTC